MYRYDDLKIKLERLLLSPLDSKVYMIIAMVGLVLLFYSIWEIKPVVVGITDFLGLASHLTLSYWAGYILIILFSIRLYLDNKIKNDFIYLIYLIIIGLFLFAVPIFAEENARYPWSYYPAGEVKEILRLGYINPAIEYPLMSYHSWPGTHIISAFIMYFTDIRIDNLIKYMPTFWILLLILITFSIGKRTKLQINKCFLASFLIVSSFWTFHYYYGPQSFAYILYLLFFMLMVAYNRHLRDMILIILSFSSLVVIHMLTSIVLIVAFFFSSKFVRSIYENRYRFMIFFLVILIAWYIYIAPIMFKTGIKEFINQATGDGLFSFARTEKYSSGELLTRQITHYSRLSYLGIYLISMTISFIYYWKGRVETENKELVKTYFYWFFGISTLLLLRYGSEIDERVYILSLLPMVYIMIMTFNRRTIVVLIIMFAFLHIPAHYGTESFEMVSTKELTGASFLALRINDTKEPYFYLYSLYINYFSPSTIYWPQERFLPINKPNTTLLDKSTYIINSNQVYNQHMYDYGDSLMNKWIYKNDYKLDYLYDNGGFKILKNHIRIENGVTV